MSPEKLLQIERRKRVVNLLLVTCIGLHAYQTYSISLGAVENQEKREATEKKYEQFKMKVLDDQFLQGLEAKLKTRDEGEIRQYVKAVCTEWGGQSEKRIPTFKNII